MIESTVSLRIRNFMKKVDIDSTKEGCWLWKGALNKQGYGVYAINRRAFLAHRVAWKLFVDTIPTGKCVLHRCDISNCVNIKHLFIGTRADNTKDMMRKGRNNPNRKLTQEQADEIRDIYRAQPCLHYKLARQFKVSVNVVDHILHNRTYIPKLSIPVSLETMQLSPMSTRQAVICTSNVC